MKKSRNILLILGLLGIVLIGLIIVFGFRYGSMRVQAENPPPQILIQRPVNLEEIPTNEGVFVHATAWDDQGVSRIEVWVDGEFTHAEDAPEGSPITPLVLNSFWQPAAEGTHEIVVRAYNSTWQSSSVSVLVNAVPPSEEELIYYDPLGLSEEQPADSGQTDEEPTGEEGAGEEAVEAPGSSGSGGGSGAYIPSDAGGGTPPEDSEPDPYTIPMLFGFFDLIDIFGEDEEDGAPAEDSDFLKLEILSLETDQAYEGVHCYVGFGGRVATWYPDEDRDQSTHEDFSPTGENHWNVAEYLSEENAKIIYWPEQNEIPIRVNCIGTAGGGTEAIGLGMVESTIPPDHWDGIVRSKEASAEGSYTFEYRVSYAQNVAKDPTDRIPPPYNVRFDADSQEIRWDWERGEDMEGNIAGFLVFVNDVLIYQISSADFSFHLPSEWLHPPCDQEYVITLRAFQNPYPDGDYSYASEPVTFPHALGGMLDTCNPQVVVTFETLVTGDLGEDDIPNNWLHVVQPVQGIFFANEATVEFNHVTLYPDQSYNIYDLTSSTTGDANHFTYEVTEEEYMRIGFDILDYDGSRSEMLCTNSLFHDYTAARLLGSGYIEDTLYSLEEGGSRCQVHYSIRPLEGSVVGGSNPDFVPLPWLDVVGMENDPDSGNILLTIQNSGTAAWIEQDLQYDFIRRDTETRLLSLHADLTLGVGESVVLDTGINDLGSLVNLCVMLDPNDMVFEHYEALEVLRHDLYTYCLPQPDLRIEEVRFDTDSSTLFVKVRNMGGMSNVLGTSDVDVSDIDLRIDPAAEGPNMTGPSLREHEIIRRAEVAWIEWTIRPEMRENMLEGYTITVDPDNLIYEIDESNNSYDVPSGATLKVAWDAMRLRWYPGSLQTCPNNSRWASNSVDVWVDVYTVSEYNSDRQVRWHWEGDTEGDNVLYVPGYHGWMRTPYTVVFFIEPEQNMEIRVHGEQSGDSMGAITAVFEAERNWEISDSILNEDSWCDEDELRDRGRGISIYPGGDWSWCGEWDIWVNICEVESPTE